MTAFQLFYTFELDVYQPAGSVPTAVKPGHGSKPHGGSTFTIVANTSTIRASDIGWRSRSTDAGGVLVYPPILKEAFSIDRQVNLDPRQSTAAAAWGAATLLNTGQFSLLVANQNSDGQRVSIKYAAKSYDDTRGIFVDPPRAQLVNVFQGLAAPWLLSDTELVVPLRDATYWMEKIIPGSRYSGAGGYNGTAQITGKMIPKARGGTASFPIRQVAPVLIDPTNNIYQYNDGAGTVVALYEGGDTNIVFDSNTANLYSGSTPAGKYRTDNSRGLFQLGSTAVRQITADVTGQFPVAGVKTTAFAIAQYLLSEDCSVPSANIDTTTLGVLDANYPYTSGIYIADDVDGVSAVAFLLSGVGAKLFPKRDGTLSAFVLRAPFSGPIWSLNKTNIIELKQRDLPAGVYPPPYRIALGYQKCWTVQTSGLSPLVTSAQQDFLAHEYRDSVAVSTAIQTAYRRPNLITTIPSALLSVVDANLIVADFLTLWATRRRLYEISVPLTTGIGMELGDIVSVTYPSDDLQYGKLGIIVGDSYRSQDPFINIQVLV